MAPDESPAEGLLSLAERLARETGELILAGRSKGIVDVDTKSTGTDMVTEFDRAAETLIVSELRRLRPDDAIVGEEGTDRPGTSGIAWLIDPIDGTTNFLYGLPGYAVSIAASDARRPARGRRGRADLRRGVHGAAGRRGMVQRRAAVVQQPDRAG